MKIFIKFYLQKLIDYFKKCLLNDFKISVIKCKINNRIKIFKFNYTLNKI